MSVFNAKTLRVNPAAACKTTFSSVSACLPCRRVCPNFLVSTRFSLSCRGSWFFLPFVHTYVMANYIPICLTFFFWKSLVYTLELSQNYNFQPSTTKLDNKAHLAIETRQIWSFGLFRSEGPKPATRWGWMGADQNFSRNWSVGLYPIITTSPQEF